MSHEHELASAPLTTARMPVEELVRSAASDRGPFAHSFAVLVGIDTYPHLRHLATAVADVEALADVLHHLHGYDVKVLKNADASKAGVEAAIAELRGQASDGDRALFYFAGHGFAEVDERDQLHGFLAPHDARRDDDDSLLSMRVVREALVALTAGHVLLVADCCFAGALDLATRDIATHTPMVLERYQRYVRCRARQFLASAAYDERALDIVVGRPVGDRGTTADGHSPFAQAMLDGLRGAADLNGDGLITIRELELHVENRFAEIEHRYQTKMQRPVLRTLDGTAMGEFVFFHPNRPLALPSAAELNEDNNPFRGLLPFTTRDEALFFGRTAASRRLLAAAEKHAAVLLVGASGSGKSSLLAAGLMPRWTDGHPGAEVLGPLTPNAALSVQRGDQPAPSLIVVDQLEELWTRGDTAVRKQFFDWLREQHAAGSKLVCGLRADFEAYFGPETAAQHLAFERFVIPPPSRAELREMVLGPCDVKALFFEPPELVDQLVEDTAEMAGSLPLLSFALSELYRGRVERGGNDRTLLADDYRGVMGALGHALADLDARYRAGHDGPRLSRVLRWVLLRMVDAEQPEPTGRVIARAEIDLPDSEDTECADRVIADLERRRLIVSDVDHEGRRVIRPAHDALVRSWSVLQTWIKEEQSRNGGLALQRRLRDWTMHKGPLWTGRQLDIAHDLIGTDAPLNRNEVGFLRDSRRAQRKRTRWLVGSIATAMTLIIGAAIVALLARRTAVANLEQANRNLAQAFADQARKAQRDQDLLSAKVLFARSLVLERNDTVLENLISVWNGGGLKWRIAGAGTSDCARLAIPNRSQLAVVGGLDGVLSARRLDSGELAWQRNLGGAITAVAASPDGATVAAGGKLGVVALLSSHDGTPLSEVRLDAQRDGSRPWISNLALGAEVLGVGTEVNGVELYNLRASEPSKPIWGASAHEESVGGVAFTLDATIFLWSAFGYIWATDVIGENGKHDNNRLVPARASHAIAAHPNSPLIAFGDSEIGITLLDLRRGPIGRLSQHDREVNALKFNMSGDILASAGNDGYALLWDTSTDRRFATLQWSSPAQGQPVCDAAEDAGTVVIVTADGTVSAYHRQSDDITTIETPDPVREVVARSEKDHPDRSNPLASGLETGRYDNGIQGILVRPNGTLASISNNGTIRIRKHWNGTTFEDVRTDGLEPFVKASPEVDAIATISFQRDKLALRDRETDSVALAYTAPEHERLLAVAVASHGSRVLVASSTGMVRMFDRGAKEPSWARSMAKSGINRIALGPATDTYALASDNTFVLAQVQNASELIRRPLASAIHDIVVTEQFAGAITSEAASLWDLRTLELRMIRSGGHRLAISSDARWLAIGGDEGQLELWELPLGVLRSRIKIPGFAGAVTALAFATSTDRLFVGGREAKIYVVDVQQIIELIDMNQMARQARAEQETGYMVQGTVVVPRPDNASMRVSTAL